MPFKQRNQINQHILFNQLKGPNMYTRISVFQLFVFLSSFFSGHFVSPSGATIQ